MFLNQKGEFNLVIMTFKNKIKFNLKLDFLIKYRYRGRIFSNSITMLITLLFYLVMDAFWSINQSINQLLKGKLKICGFFFTAAIIIIMSKWSTKSIHMISCCLIRSYLPTKFKEFCVRHFLSQEYKSLTVVPTIKLIFVCGLWVMKRCFYVWNKE